MSRPIRSAPERLWLTGGAFALLLVAVLAWFVVVHPTLADAHDAELRTVQAQDANTTLNSRVQQLRQRSDALTSVQTALRDARATLPVGADVEVFTGALVAGAAASGVVVTGITATPPTPVAGTGTPVAGADSASGMAAASTTGQLYAVHVSVVATGSHDGLAQFLRAVQSGPRAALITRVSIAATADAAAGQSGAAAQDETLTVEADIFLAPQRSDASEVPVPRLDTAGR